MKWIAVQIAILFVFIHLPSGGPAHAQLVGGSLIATPADEPKTYEDDASDLEDFFRHFSGGTPPHPPFRSPLQANRGGIRRDQLSIGANAAR